MAPASRKKCLIYLTLATLLSGLNAGPVSADVGLWAAPPIPAWITATEGNYTNRVFVDWPGSTGATKYKVFRTAHGYSIWEELVYYGLTNYHDYSAVPATVYDYAVRACNASDECSPMTSRAVGYRRLAPPENVTASDGGSISAVTITWSASEQAAYYRVYRATSAGGYKTDLGYSYSTSFDDTSAIPGTDYYYFVKAFETVPVYDMNSEYSDYDVGYRLIGLPYAIWATDGTFTDKVVVSWPAVTGATSYEVYRGTNQTTWNTYWDGITNTYYWDTSAIPGWFYYYWVVPCDSHGCRNAGTGPDDGWCVAPSPTPTETNTPSPEPTLTPSHTPRPTRTPTPSRTPLPTLTPTQSRTANPTATRTPTLSASVTPQIPSAWLYLPLVMRD
jgi:fibronectin type 3 domain-containing protein